MALLPDETDSLTSLKALFTYQNISTSKELNDEAFIFYSRIELSTIFIKFSYIGEDTSYTPKLLPGQKRFPPGGWKLHIAVDDTNPENLSRAWDIVKDILIEYRMAVSKVIKPDISLAKDTTQKGKQITIYYYFNPAPQRDWDRILNEIDNQLFQADIKPVHPDMKKRFSPTDRPIINSRYISYRNDLTEDSKSVLDSKVVKELPKEKRYNPLGRTDPFTGISIRLQAESTTHLSLKK